MTLFLIGSRARYLDELQAILADSGLPAGVPVDNLLNGGAETTSRIWPLSQILDESGSYILCPSPPGIRSNLAHALVGSRLRVGEPLIHPSASVAENVRVGRGSTVNRLVSIGVHVQVGRHCQVNRSASIGHDCCVNDFVTVGPGVVIASNVNIAAGAFVGAGAVILPSVQLGSNCIVGAGAVVTKDVPSYATVVGNPARVSLVSETGYKGFTV